MATTETRWNPSTGVLHTELTGPATTDDVANWRAGLHRELAKVPDGATFRLLLNLYNFEPLSLAAHKAMRNVVPELLARHGLRPAFIDLFDERPELPITTARGVRCVAFANVHHDETKMASYEARIAKPEQRFFTDVREGEAWLRTAGS